MFNHPIGCPARPWLIAAVLLAFVPLLAHAEVSPELKRLRDTASGFRTLAEKKKADASAAADEAAKVRLLEAVARLEAFASETEERARQEEFLCADPDVLAARAAENAAAVALTRAEEEIEGVKTRLQSGSSTGARGSLAEDFIGRMNAVEERRAALATARGAREAVERTAWAHRKAQTRAPEPPSGS